jgi:DNA-binding HxlR family transcriptional regulator
VRRTATSRARAEFLRKDSRELSEHRLLRAQASPVFAIYQGGRQANLFSTGEESAVEFAISLIEGKWKVPILRQLQGGPIHLGELKRRLAPISKKVLNQHLRQMVNHGLIIRTDYAGKMPRVEYHLANPLGYAALDLLQAVAEWGGRYGANTPKMAT